MKNNHLEPTYLRYIYDGLVKGSIHPENAAELPEGLIGMYEEAFDERTSVIDRQKLLKRFAVWALLKKEVSVAFVAEVLGEPEANLQDFISAYSAWFNSQESGKYQLYHERLKVYLLQKLSEQEVRGLHEKLISRLQQAIEEQNADEFEWYGLEFLSAHLSVVALLTGEAKQLMNVSYSQTHWQRQLKISKGYTWTKNGLIEVMSWASKYNDDEVIECGLQMVDLYHQEQNAAPQIVALVAEGAIDSALKRIEQFGGSDKEGLQRKFILYMLCLMELTLLDSKDTPFQKTAIEKILKHLDEHLPVDHSVLNWSDFFSSYLLFQVAEKLHELEIAYDTLFKSTKYWESDWFNTIKVVSTIQIDLFVRAAKFTSDPYWRSLKLSEIAKLSFTKGNAYRSDELMNEASIICSTVEGGLKNNLLCELGESYISQNNHSKAIHILDEFQESCQEKISILSRIISYLILNKKSQNIKSLVVDLNFLIESLEDNYQQSLSKIELVKIQTQLGEIEEAIIVANSIKDDTRVRINALYQIIISAKNNSNIQALNQFLNELIVQIDDDWERDIAYTESIDSLLILGKHRECEEIICQIKNEYWSNGAILKLSNFHLNENQDRDKSLKLLNQLPDLTIEKFEGYINHINFLIINCDHQQAEKLFHKVWNSSQLIEFEFDRISVQRKLVEIKLSECQLEYVANLFFNQIGIAKGTLTKKFQKEVLFDLLKNHKDLKRVNAEKIISEDLLTNYVLNAINSELETLNNFKQLIHLKRINDAMLLIDHVEDLYFKSSLMRYAIQVDVLEFDVKNELINQLVLCTDKVNNVFWKCHSMTENILVLKSIYSENDLERYIQEVIELALQLKDWFSIQLLALISTELFAVKLVSEANALINKSLELTKSLNKEDKEKALLVICVALVKLDKSKEAQKILNGIRNNSNKSADISFNSKCEALYLIAEVILSKGEQNIAEDFIRQIENTYWKNKGYKSLILNFISFDKISESIHLSNSLPLSNSLRSVWQEIGNQKMIPSYQLQELRSELFEFFMIGEIEAIKLSDFTKCKSKQLIFQNKNNFNLLFQCLTKSILHKMFYQTEKNELINRCIHSLNIQWALDLNQQLN